MKPSELLSARWSAKALLFVAVLALAAAVLMAPGTAWADANRQTDPTGCVASVEIEGTTYYYAKVADAVADAQGNGVTDVQLVGDATDEQDITINDGHAIKIFMSDGRAGHSIGFEKNKGTGFVVNHGSLELVGDTTKACKVTGSVNWGSYLIAVHGSNDPNASRYSVVTVGEGVSLEPTDGENGIEISPLLNQSDTIYGIVVTLNGSITGGANGDGKHTIGIEVANAFTKESGKSGVNLPRITLGSSSVIECKSSGSNSRGIEALGYAKWELQGSSNSGPGAQITAPTAIYVENGIFNIAGGTYTSTGALIADDSQRAHSAALEIREIGGRSSNESDITITGGTFKSTSNHVVYQRLKEGATEPSIKLHISGGTFTTNATGKQGVYVDKDALNPTEEPVSGIVTGGTFSSDPSKYGDIGDSSKHYYLDDSVPNQYTVVPYVAEVDGTMYKTLRKAVEQVQVTSPSDTVIKLLADAEVEADPSDNNGITVKEGAALRIDLNNHDITFTGHDGNDHFVVEKATLELMGHGTVKGAATNQAPVVVFGDDDPNGTPTNVTIGAGVTLIGYDGLRLWETNGVAYGVTINIDGTLHSTGEGRQGILVQGNIKAISAPGALKLPEINLGPSSVVKAYEKDTCGIYAAGYAKWNLAGSVVAPNALSIKCGEFNIAGGTYWSTGPYVETPLVAESRSEFTGAAASITSNKGYTHKTDIVIKGGSFASANGNALFEGIGKDEAGNPAAPESYATVRVEGGSFTGGVADDGGRRPAVAVTTANDKQVIVGGTYSSDVSSYCASERECNAIRWDEDGNPTLWEVANPPIVDVTRIRLDRTELDLTAGESADLTAIVQPDDATDKTVTWISSSESVATVNDGTVTGVADGKTFITATAGGKSAVCIVSVTGNSKAQRLGGANRYETMALVSRTAWPEDGSCSTVVIARGDDFPDALSAAGLAGVLGGQVLITNTDALTPETAAEIARLGATKAYVLGDEHSVSSAAFDEVKALVPDTERLCGTDRTKTALAIYGAGEGLWGSTAIVSLGSKAPDALSASAVAYALKAPIFLADGDGSVSDELLAAVKAGGFSTVLVTGSAASVSDEAFGALKALVSDTERLGGADRYETSLIIAKWAFDHGMDYVRMAFTAGRDGKFADALVASALAGKSASMLVLTDEGVVDGTNAALIAPNKGFITDVYLLGDSNSLSDELARKVAKALI